MDPPPNTSIERRKSAAAAEALAVVEAETAAAAELQAEVDRKAKLTAAPTSPISPIYDHFSGKASPSEESNGRAGLAGRGVPSIAQDSLVTKGVPKQIVRAELAANLLAHDNRPSIDASRSAILTPFRHLLTPKSTETGGSYSSEPQDYLNYIPSSSVINAAKAGTYSTSKTDSASGSGSQLLGRSLSEGGGDEHYRSNPFTSESHRYSSSAAGGSSSFNGTKGLTSRSVGPLGSDHEEQESLAVTSEWGLGDFLANLGTGSEADPLSAPERLNKNSVKGKGKNPTSNSDSSRTGELKEITSSQPDSAQGGSGIKLKIIERKPGDPRPTVTQGRTPFAVKSAINANPPNRRHSSDTGQQHQTSTGAEFEGLFNFGSGEDEVLGGLVSSNKERKSSLGSNVLLTPNDASNSPATQGRFSLGGLRRTTETSTFPTQARSNAHTSATPSTSPPVFTSRFDPIMVALAKQEIEKERPVFVNKEAGLPPKVILMPTPLAGQSVVQPTPKRRFKTEGPDLDSPDSPRAAGDGEELGDRGGGGGGEVDDSMELGPQRPAGALYGRSLMDVLAERQDVQKARAKAYVPGQDGRRAMMDLGAGSSTQAAASRLPTLTSTGGEEATTDSSPQVVAPGKGRAVGTVFGPDLLYQRDMEKMRIVEAQEEEERKVEEEEEAAMWEHERVKAEKKQAKKGRKLQRKSLVLASIPDGKGPPKDWSELDQLRANRHNSKMSIGSAWANPGTNSDAPMSSARDAASIPPLSAQGSSGILSGGYPSSEVRFSPIPSTEMAPMLSLPLGQELEFSPATSWFGVRRGEGKDSGADSDSSTDSSSDNRNRQYARPTSSFVAPHSSPLQNGPFPQRPPIIGRHSTDQRSELRSAVMLGLMTYQEAAAESARLGLGSGMGSGSQTHDDNHLGEDMARRTEVNAPPRFNFDVHTRAANMSQMEKEELGGLKGMGLTSWNEPSLTHPGGRGGRGQDADKGDDDDDENIESDGDDSSQGYGPRYADPVREGKIDGDKGKVGNGNEGEDEDDVPLGTRFQEDDDDLPLGFKASGLNQGGHPSVYEMGGGRGPSYGTMGDDEDEDDRPLGLTAEAIAQQRQSHAMLLEHQHHSQQQVMYMHAAQQNAMFLARQQQDLDMGVGNFGGDYDFAEAGGVDSGRGSPVAATSSGGMVERWRQGITRGA